MMKLLNNEWKVPELKTNAQLLNISVKPTKLIQCTTRTLAILYIAMFLVFFLSKEHPNWLCWVLKANIFWSHSNCSVLFYFDNRLFIYIFIKQFLIHQMWVMCFWHVVNGIIRPYVLVHECMRKCVSQY
jgi:hypothetical protein